MAMPVNPTKAQIMAEVARAIPLLEQNSIMAAFALTHGGPTATVNMPAASYVENVEWLLAALKLLQTKVKA